MAELNSSDPTTPRIPLSRPDVSEAEVQEVLGVLRTPFLSMGPKVVEFEARFAAFLGLKHAIAVSNGTCGLHLAARAVGVRPGTEVLTTPFTFVATANVVLLEGAFPVFVDVDPKTLNLTPEGLRATIEREYAWRDGGLLRRATGAPLVAILPVSVFGHPVQMDGVKEIAEKYSLPILHDTCEAFGSLYQSARHDTWVSEALLADAAVYAFYPNKQLTTGEGGMVVTQSDEIATYCRMARNQGRRPGADWLEHETLGFNYRMDELSAAMGVAQMRRAGELLAKRARVAAWYDEALADLADLNEVERPSAAPWARVSWFVYVVRLRRGIDRDTVTRFLAGRGVAAKPYFPAVHLQPHLRSRGYEPGAFPITEDIASRTLALPYYNELTRDEVDHVVRALREAITSHVRA